MNIKNHAKSLRTRRQEQADTRYGLLLVATTLLAALAGYVLGYASAIEAGCR